jgi:hypothetical protein
MNFFAPKYHYLIHPEKGIQVKIDEDLNRFNVDLLNIGDLRAPSKTIEVLSVSFDLEGFTTNEHGRTAIRTLSHHKGTRT